MANEIAPIAVFVYNRLDHAKRTIEALALNSLAKKSTVFIFSDASKSEQNDDKVANVRAYINSGIDKYFKELIIIEAEYNKGLACSLIYGISKVVTEYGKAIVLEDDIVTTPDFLEYMNRALLYYEDDERIWSIGGFSFDMPCLRSYTDDVYVHPRACSWGWATWKNRWNKVNWQVPDYYKYQHNWFKRYSFFKCGIDLPTMLDAQMYCDINSWYIRWCYYSWKNKAYTVYPVNSRVELIGNDGSGVHGSQEDSRFKSTVVTGDSNSIELKRIGINQVIRKQYNRVFAPNRLNNCKCGLKWILIRLRILNPQKHYFWQK